MKQRTHDLITGWIAAGALLVALLLSVDAFATTPKPPPPTTDPAQQQEQHQGQSQYQHQGQEQSQANKQQLEQSIDTAAAASASAMNEGNSLSVNQNYAQQAPDVVLVPSRNIVNCGTNLGVGGSNEGGSFILGIPLPSNFLWMRQGEDCNLDRAADDARSDGLLELAWFYTCQKPSIYKAHRQRGDKRRDAIQRCVTNSVGPITLQRRLDAANDQLKFIENERKIEQKNFINQREQAKADCAEALDRQHKTCMRK